MITQKREITSSLMLLLHERVTSDEGERPVLWFVLDILDQKLSMRGRGEGEPRNGRERKFERVQRRSFLKYMLPVQLALYTFLLSVHLSLFLLLRFTTLFIYTHIHAYFKYLSVVCYVYLNSYKMYMYVHSHKHNE